LRNGKREQREVFTKDIAQTRLRSFLEDLKDQIRIARVRASLSVNRQMIELYLEVGRRILEQQAQESWGMSVVEGLSRDLRREFPDLSGFSPRDMWDMRRLYESVQEHSILQQLVAEIPWGHNLVLLNSVKNPDKRQWYIHQVIQHGWSRSVLTMQIENDVYSRKGKAVTNFFKTLPQPQSHLAPDVLNYSFPTTPTPTYFLKRC
jgi:predicted nuclease of restriction endonuclease-like (RecB) superfamily